MSTPALCTGTTDTPVVGKSVITSELGKRIPDHRATHRATPLQVPKALGRWRRSRTLQVWTFHTPSSVISSLGLVTRGKRETRRAARDKLMLFCDNVDRVLSRSAITQGTISASFRLVFDQESGLQVETNLGDEDHVRSLLLDFRKFLSESEDVCFFSVANVVERAVSNDQELRDANRSNRDQWKDVLRGYQIAVNQKTYTPEDCFKLVINGGLFHDDAAKAEELERMIAPARASVVVNVNRLVIKAIPVLIYERNLIRTADERGLIETT